MIYWSTKQHTKPGNVYTKGETDALLDKKANKDEVYTKQEVDAKIPNLQDYYTKQEIDQSQQTQNTNIDNNRQNIENVRQSTETNATDIQGLENSKADKQALTTLEGLVQQNIVDIGTKANIVDVYNKNDTYNKTEVDAKIAAIPTIDAYTKTESDNKYLDKTREGVLPHKFTIQSNDENLKLKSNEAARSVYIGFYKGSGNDRVGYIGRASGSNHHIQVVAEKADGNVILQAGANGVVECKNKRVIDVATPTANNDATNKTYVDNTVNNAVNGVKLKQQVIKRTIPNDTNYLLLDGLNQGRKIAGYEMYRKRAADGWYFKRPETSYQLIRFEDRIQIYPIAENGFSNDWWIIINYFEY